MRPALFFALLLALLTIKTARAEPVQAPHIAVDIKADVSTFVPGQPFWVAVNFVPEPHWHTYWQNPGDSGLAPTLDWQLPPAGRPAPFNGKCLKPSISAALSTSVLKAHQTFWYSSPRPKTPKAWR